MRITYTKEPLQKTTDGTHVTLQLQVTQLFPKECHTGNCLLLTASSSQIAAVAVTAVASAFFSFDPLDRRFDRNCKTNDKSCSETGTQVLRLRGII